MGGKGRVRRGYSLPRRPPNFLPRRPGIFAVWIVFGGGE